MEKRDVLTDIAADHELMRGLIRRLRDPGAKAARQRSLLPALGAWIQFHAEAEARTINQYGKRHRGLRVLAYEDAEEHRTIASLFRKLQRTRANPHLWAARLRLLCELLDHHLDEEEEEYLPMLRERLDAGTRERLSKRYQALTERLEELRPRPKPGIIGWLAGRPGLPEATFT